VGLKTTFERSKRRRGYHDNQVRCCAQVTATDWDAGDNGRLYYSVPGSMASIFHVDQRGVISAHESIDRERYDAFRFPVLAVDSGLARSRQTGSALVIISVEDVNDERPMFAQPTYLFTIEENQRPATVVCRLYTAYRHDFSTTVDSVCYNECFVNREYIAERHIGVRKLVL